MLTPVKYFMVEKILSENSGLPAPKRHGVDQRMVPAGGERAEEDLAVNNSRYGIRSRNPDLFHFISY